MRLDGLLIDSIFLVLVLLWLDDLDLAHSSHLTHRLHVLQTNMFSLNLFQLICHLLLLDFLPDLLALFFRCFWRVFS
jgi:hypothetical protein